MPDPAAPLAAPPPTDFGLAGTAMHMALALLLVLAVIYAAYWLLRRFGGRFGIGPAGRGGLLRLQAHLSLGPRKSIVVVRFLHKNLVLGVTDHAITLLTEEPADDDDIPQPQQSFAAALAAKTRPPEGGGPASSP
ncbi:flagellar biosynthetic protein FliO [Solidesulfovibrio sp.]|uniref:flagellar biosynthetic protein FliO n=1 Tax=Solidesulfovibrio sp. TaxID=2910990 RepID=UPI002627300E|nr:flagellar biosynthetic protein FliO [Solidesulfovibrio sp.]